MVISLFFLFFSLGGRFPPLPPLPPFPLSSSSSSTSKIAEQYKGKIPRSSSIPTGTFCFVKCRANPSKPSVKNPSKGSLKGHEGSQKIPIVKNHSDIKVKRSPKELQKDPTRIKKMDSKEDPMRIPKNPDWTHPPVTSGSWRIPARSPKHPWGIPKTFQKDLDGFDPPLMLDPKRILQRSQNGSWSIPEGSQGL